MTEEQYQIVELFRRNFENDKDKKIIIYGTGILAETVIRNCPDFLIIGLLDQAKTGKMYWNLKVMSDEEAAKSGCDYIVIVARPSVHSIIYKRICQWTKKAGIPVFDIKKCLIEEKIKQIEIQSPYFDFSYEHMWDQIKTHDIISFDIFDTLLTRKTYCPEDVFDVMALHVKTEIEDFASARMSAQKDLPENANIFQIYDLLAKSFNLSKDKTMKLLEEEVCIEKKILLVRERMKECFRECIYLGKPVYLVSDMYLPKEILIAILDSFGIIGYKDILISCDYSVSKEEGLFDILKEKTLGYSCLHIGDNHVADCVSALRSGIDSFEIMAPIKMMEISTYKDLLAHTETITYRMMLGMLATEVFNDPFALYHSQGKPTVIKTEKFGYIFLGPLLVAFVLWLLNEVRDKKNAVILFSARDGYLIQQVYHIFKNKCKENIYPKDIYFLISRHAIINAVENAEEKIRYTEYLDSLKLSSFSDVFFVDFMSRGTCQYELEKLSGLRMKGLYFQKSLSDNDEKNHLNVTPFFRDKSVVESNKRIFAMCDFLECIFTSFQPSFSGFADDLTPVYEKETRSDEQLNAVMQLHNGIKTYCKQFTDFYDQAILDVITPEVCDEFLTLTENELSNIEIPVLKKLELDDFEQNKNVGRDVFL